MKDMKARIIMIIMAVALIALPTMAQEDPWQSTSSMQGSGSAYSSQVTAVGATGVSDMATTTESYSPAKAPGGPRKGFDLGAETGKSEEYPLGDAVLPMMIMAMLFAGVVYTRRKKALNR
jgi:hypothetical protein